MPLPNMKVNKNMEDHDALSSPYTREGWWCDFPSAVSFVANPANDTNWTVSHTYLSFIIIAVAKARSR